MPILERASRLQCGDVVSGHRFVTISGLTVPIPDHHQRIHLQFRRFAGCPVCDLHLRSVARRHPELAAAGVREVVVFHSTAAELSAHAADLPFDIIADPDKQHYREFGVESGPRALLDPRAWLPILRGIGRSLVAVLRKRHPLPSINPYGGRFGLPADFLIARDGRLLACKYGAHAYDQWSVDDVLALADSDGGGPRLPRIEGRQ